MSTNKPKYNKSKTYLLPLIAPLIGIEKKFFDNIDNTYLINDGDDYIDCFFITHDFEFKNPEFTAYEHRLISNELFQKSIDLPNNQVLYIFKFPEEYLHEYKCFVNGKYSEFKEDAKQQILSFWTEIYGKNHAGVNFVLMVKKILYKDKRLKETLEKKLNVTLDNTSELGDIIDIKNETLTVE